MMQPGKRWQRLGSGVILTILVFFGISSLGIDSVEARSFYLPPGAKTESKKREDTRKRTRYNRQRAQQMLHDDLRYREAESEFRYREERRKLELEKKRRELEKDR
ncbi:MAG: hypothetical protein RBR09_04505 [Desulfobulbaceae bacterium]|jgi:hypothetical protein|nr:hypothetical protein [Desulfobulbaceae bacterium]